MKVGYIRGPVYDSFDPVSVFLPPQYAELPISRREHVIDVTVWLVQHDDRVFSSCVIP